MRCLPILIACLIPAAARGTASTAILSDWICSSPDVIQRSGFETGENTPRRPSLGSGGAAMPADQVRSVTVPGLTGTRSYYLHLPPGYDSGRAWPLLIALHGSGGPGWTSDQLAEYVRSLWSAQADAGGFLLLAPASNDSNTGGWDPDYDIPILDAELADLFAAYNIEESRVHLWGFSAGAHYAHFLALANTGFFAAYAVNAGALTQYACTDDGSIPPSCNTLLGGTLRKIPVDIRLGNTDPLYVSYGAGLDPARFGNNGWTSGQNLFFTLFSGGHAYPSTAQTGEIWTHLCPFAVVP